VFSLKKLLFSLNLRSLIGKDGRLDNRVIKKTLLELPLDEKSIAMIPQLIEDITKCQKRNKKYKHNNRVSYHEGIVKKILFIVTNPFVLPDKNTESCPDSKRFKVCFEVGI
jgi:hypothetical protein